MNFIEDGRKGGGMYEGRSIRGEEVDSAVAKS